jgi:hypothetical protein
MSVDYFGRFFTRDGFDFGKLLDADFFQPIRILFQAKHYVSATKLLLVSIDSLSYVEYGDVQGGFVRWLNAFAELPKLGITAEELWEHRNSLLHMSNLDSRKVQAGSVRRLMSYVGTLPAGVKLNDASTGYFNLQALILEFAAACERWVETYNADRSKIDSFVERYDLIASDARMLWVEVAADT